MAKRQAITIGYHPCYPILLLKIRLNSEEHKKDERQFLDKLGSQKY